jgi:hypothetical protein
MKGSLYRKIGIAVLVVVLQVAAAMLLAPDNPDSHLTYGNVVYYPPWDSNPPDFSGWLGHYRRLNEWDSIHYLSIADKGYVSSGAPTAPSIYRYEDNEGHFPGIPLAGKIVSSLTGLSPDLGLLVAAQLSAVLLWLYLLLILEQYGVPKRESILTVVAIASFPTSFFLVAGYAEPLLIAGLLGMIYWYEAASHEDISSSQKRFRLALSAFHGAWMSAARLVALPLSFYPLFCEGAHYLKKEKTSWVSGALSSLGASLGWLGFFAYFWVKFDHWDYYFIIQRIGWRSRADFLAPLKLSSYFPMFYGMDQVHTLDAEVVVAFCGGVLWYFVSAWKEFRKGEVLKIYELAPLFVSALILFYIPFIVACSNRMESMSRYILPVLFLLVLTSKKAKSSGESFRISVIELSFLVLCIWLQLYLLSFYMHGVWVA